LIGHIRGFFQVRESPFSLKLTIVWQRFPYHLV
jgi:hypothetical protein